MTAASLLKLFRLTRREYFADFFITPPLTVALMIVSLQAFGAWWLPLFGAGLLAWTLYEYAAHRWLLHRAWFFRDMHALHHADQKDYIATPPLLTLVAYGTFWAVFGLQSSSFMVGFSVGYVVYSVVHTAFHYTRPPPLFWSSPIWSPWWMAYRRHQLHHHFDDVNYGVTTRLWDRVFGTAM